MFYVNIKKFLNKKIHGEKIRMYLIFPRHSGLEFLKLENVQSKEIKHDICTSAIRNDN